MENCQCRHITLSNKAHITYVRDIDIHLQQKAFIEKCSLNKDVLQKSVTYAQHCYIPVIKILEKYLSRPFILLFLQGNNLQLYRIRGVSRTPTTSKEH